MNEAVLADIEIAGTSPAPPVVLPSLCDVMLEIVQARERFLPERHYLFENLLLAFTQRLELPVAIMNNPDRGRESQVDRAMGHSQSVFWTAHPAAQHGIDVDVKVSMFGQQREFLVEHLQAFLRDIVGHHIVDADLQIFEAGTIQTLDAIGYQQIAVRNQPGNDSIPADSGDDGVQIGMEQRFAATDRNHPGPHFAEPVDSTEHFLR